MGENKCFFQKLNLGMKNTVPPLPYTHRPGMTKTRGEERRNHLFDYMVSKS